MKESAEAIEKLAFKLARPQGFSYKTPAHAGIKRIQSGQIRSFEVSGTDDGFGQRGPGPLPAG